jgi:hypothetical protein
MGTGFIDNSNTDGWSRIPTWRDWFLFQRATIYLDMRGGEVAERRQAARAFLAEEVRLYAGTTKNDDGRVFPFTAELRLLLQEARMHQYRALYLPQVPLTC